MITKVAFYVSIDLSMEYVGYSDDFYGGHYICSDILKLVLYCYVRAKSSPCLSLSPLILKMGYRCHMFSFCSQIQLLPTKIMATIQLLSSINKISVKLTSERMFVPSFPKPPDVSH